MVAQLRETAPNGVLELVENYEANRASVHAILGSEGRGMRGLREARGTAWQSKVLYLAETLDKVMSGRLPTYILKEAMTTSDFPLLFGDVIDRMMLANYQATNSTYRNYCKISTVADFRPVHRFVMNGSEATLPIVGEQEEYSESSLAEGRYVYQVAKYGRKVPFAWEAMVNDDLNALKDVPARLGRAAARTEEKFATGLFVDANGPDATLYSSDNKNIVGTANGASATNPALSISGLQDAFIVLSHQVDADGEPIFIDAVELVVPPALEVTANNILNASDLWIGGFGQAGAGGVAAQALYTANWMRNRVRLSVNYYIPHLASSSNGNTSWFLFANPDATRPAIEIGFLRGHDTPEFFVKAPTSMRVGGGTADPMDGDFDTDSIIYKVRHVIGGVTEEPKMTVGSNGSGS